MKHDDDTLIKFGFMIKKYYRDGEGVREVKGIKTRKLFLSWFRLMKSRGRLLYGYIKIEDGQIWIWQNPNRVYRGGWQKVRNLKSPKQLTLAL